MPLLPTDLFIVKLLNYWLAMYAEQRKAFYIYKKSIYLKYFLFSFLDLPVQLSHCGKHPSFVIRSLFEQQ